MSIFSQHIVTINAVTKTLNATTGKYATVTTARKIRATIQPATPEDLDRLPESDRKKKHILVVSGDSLLIDEIIVWKNENYRIIDCDDFTCMGLLYEGQYQALAVRE